VVPAAFGRAPAWVCRDRCGRATVLIQAVHLWGARGRGFSRIRTSICRKQPSTACWQPLSAHAVVPVVLWDEQEHTLPAAGFASVVDAESGAKRFLWLRPTLRARFEQRVQQRRSELTRRLTHQGLPPLFLTAPLDADCGERVFPCARACRHRRQACGLSEQVTRPYVPLRWSASLLGLGAACRCCARPRPADHDHTGGGRARSVIRWATGSSAASASRLRLRGRSRRRALPAPGRLNAWFELAEISVQTDTKPAGTEIELRLVYQLPQLTGAARGVVAAAFCAAFRRGWRTHRTRRASGRSIRRAAAPRGAADSTLDAPRADRKPN